MEQPATRFQIRLRTDVPFRDLQFLHDWISSCREGFAFHHDLPDNSHYHIYLFGLEREADSMRKHLKRYMIDKTKYSVSTTAGGRKRLPILPQLAYQYGTTDSLLSPVWSKGYTDEQLECFKDCATRHYDEVKNPPPPTEGVLITREEHYVVRPDRVWERLSAKSEDYADMTVRGIKSKLCAEWLNAGRAVPRPSDLHRYAVSLFLLNKYQGEVPDDAYAKLEACS